MQNICTVHTSVYNRECTLMHIQNHTQKNKKKHAHILYACVLIAIVWSTLCLPNLDVDNMDGLCLWVRHALPQALRWALCTLSTLSTSVYSLLLQLLPLKNLSVSQLQGHGGLVFTSTILSSSISVRSCWATAQAVSSQMLMAVL